MTALAEEKTKPTQSSKMSSDSGTKSEKSSAEQGTGTAAHHDSNLEMSAFQRLNLGPVGPECLKNPALKPMVDPTWIHLGGEPVKPILERWTAKWHHLRQNIKSMFLSNSNRVLPDNVIENRTKFRPFHYEYGKRINLPSGNFSFIFSENYFQRFFIDEADAQFRECFRLLEEGGVLRIVVPDADLRTHSYPEPVGFPQNLDWNAPEKHKTRWSIYSLVYALENCGYHVKPVAWSDKNGKTHFDPPTAEDHVYENTADTRFSFDLTYCANSRQSLIVDAIKPPKGELAPRGHLVSILHPVGE